MNAADFSLLDGALVALAAAIVFVMLMPTVRDSPFWRATVTPLASIIGSGFLVVVPLLAGIAGPMAIVAITGIVLLSFWLGEAIRFNICHRAADDRLVGHLERASNVALAFAYVISITFYVRLLCSFVLAGVHSHSDFNADILATVILAFIGLYGWRRGLHGLERLEEYSVTIKLAIIASLLAGLAWYDMNHGYDLSGLPAPTRSLWESLRELAGMVLIVQGFETSKYLGSTYPPRLRARSMLLAQIVAGVIYVAFVVLSMPLMGPLARSHPDETAIIHLSGAITLVLPIMLVFAAAMSQFSAAVADTIGAGGVVEKEGRGRISMHLSYPVITTLAIALVWAANIFEVITLASRAFAFYYMLQAAVACRRASVHTAGRSATGRMLLFGALAVLMLIVVLIAQPVAA